MDAQISIEERVALIQKNQDTVKMMMKSVLREGEHYGVIPGTKKPTLLKSGAEIMAFTFHLDPDFETNFRDLGNGHREVITKCVVYSSQSGKRLGSASGSCSTLESKYRYRNEAAYEVTDLAIPKDAKERKSEYRKQGFGMQKVDNDWKWVKYKDLTKVENPDIADVWNTVLKMSQKRAFTAAILIVLAVSDMFTQDEEEKAGVDDVFIETPNGKVNQSTGELVDETTGAKNKSDPKKDRTKSEKQQEQYDWLHGKLKSLVGSQLNIDEKIIELNKLIEKWDKAKPDLNGQYQKGRDLLAKADESIQTGVLF